MGRKVVGSDATTVFVVVENAGKIVPVELASVKVVFNVVEVESILFSMGLSCNAVLTKTAAVVIVPAATKTIIMHFKR